MVARVIAEMLHRADDLPTPHRVGASVALVVEVDAGAVISKNDALEIGQVGVVGTAVEVVGPTKSPREDPCTTLFAEEELLALRAIGSLDIHIRSSV